MSRAVYCGKIKIGGGAPVSIQSMTNADPHDPSAILAQIEKLAEAGCEIIRLAVPDMQAAKCFATLPRADLHHKRCVYPLCFFIYFPLVDIT